MNLIWISMYLVCAYHTAAVQNNMNQMYMIIRHDISFEPFINDTIIRRIFVLKRLQCPATCSQTPNCNMVMYNYIESICSMYNSINGTFTSLIGHTVYVLDNERNPSNTRTSTIATTNLTDTVSYIEFFSNTMSYTIDSTSKLDTRSNSTIHVCYNVTFSSFNIDLIALWRFDDTANDDLGSHNGILFGGATFNLADNINQNLRLFASSLSYFSATYIDIMSSNFTIELWIRMTTVPTTNVTIIHQNNMILHISYTSFVYITEYPPAAGTALLVNQWYHIGLVHDHDLSQQKLYINGNLESWSSVQFTFSNDTMFYIGALNGTSEYFDGEIDHLSISRRMKSACEILRDASLIAAYPFTQSISARKDIGPYGFDGFISGTVDSIGTGAYGDALLFDESSDYFQINGMTRLAVPNSEFSFTLFIKPSVVRACSLIFMSGTPDISDTNQARPYLGIDSSGNLVVEIPPNFVTTISMNISTNIWSHIAVTYSFTHNRLTLYYDGLPRISQYGHWALYTPAITVPPVFITVGNPLSGSNGSNIEAQTFLGSIDEFYIWSRELDPSEVYAAAHPN